MKIVTPEEVGLSSERLQRVTTFCQDAVATRKGAGTVSLVARHGQIAHLETTGVRDLETQQPMTLDTIFRIYSMTKPITSTAAMMLVEQGKLRLFDPVAKYIPSFKQMKVLNADGSLEDQERDVNIRDLLTHAGGLTYGEFEFPPPAEIYAQAGWLDPQATNAEIVQRVTELPLFHQPGTRWHYSISTDVLGHIVELISDMSLPEFFSENILGPLGMTDTYFYVPAEKTNRLATLYMHVGDEQFVTPPPELIGNVSEGNSYSGGGGLYSTISDYYRFAQLMLNRGELDGVRLLGRKTVELMRINHLPPSAIPMDLFGMPMPGLGFGLGFGVVMDVPQTLQFQSVGNHGWSGWAQTKFWLDPEESLLAIFMTQKIPDPLQPLFLGEDFFTAVYQSLVA